VSQIVESICNLNIPKDMYEVIIIGSNSLNSNGKDGNLKFINFDELQRDMPWVTRKKNIIVQNSEFENIILIHDYVYFDPDWYNGFLKFDTDWDVCMCKIINKNGVRWRDWHVWCDRHAPPGGKLEYINNRAPYNVYDNGVLLFQNRLHYFDHRFTNTDMYISGTVIIGKKQFLINNKFNEDYTWGRGEDLEWTKRCRPFWKYKMNCNSILKLLKYKPPRDVAGFGVD